jgi:hypothetical protein
MNLGLRQESASRILQRSSTIKSSEWYSEPTSITADVTQANISSFWILLGFSPLHAESQSQLGSSPTRTRNFLLGQAPHRTGARSMHTARAKRSRRRGRLETAFRRVSDAPRGIRAAPEVAAKDPRGTAPSNLSDRFAATSSSPTST